MRILRWLRPRQDPALVRIVARYIVHERRLLRSYLEGHTDTLDYANTRPIAELPATWGRRVVEPVRRQIRRERRREDSTDA